MALCNNSVMSYHHSLPCCWTNKIPVSWEILASYFNSVSSNIYPVNYRNKKIKIFFWIILYSRIECLYSNKWIFKIPPFFILFYSFQFLNNILKLRGGSYLFISFS